LIGIEAEHKPATEFVSALTIPFITV